MLHEEEERGAASTPETAAWLEHLPTYCVPAPAEGGVSSPRAPVLIETLPTQPLFPPGQADDHAADEAGPYEGMVWVRPPQRQRRTSAREAHPREAASHEATPHERARSEPGPSQGVTPPARPHAQPPATPTEQPRQWRMPGTPAPQPPAPQPPAPQPPAPQPPAPHPSSLHSSRAQTLAHTPPRSVSPSVPNGPAPQAFPAGTGAPGDRAPGSRAPVTRAPGRVRLDVPEHAPAPRATRPLASVRPATVPLGPPAATRPLIAPTHPAQRSVDVLAKAARRPGRVRAMLVTLAILLLVNVALQFNRRSLDVASDQYAALSRVERCESLGTVPDVLFLGSSRVVHGADAQLVDQVVRQQDGLHVTSCNVGDFGSTFELDYYILKRFIEDGYTPKLVVENLWEMNLNANARGGTTLPADADAEHFGEAESVADLSDLPSLAPRFGQFGGWGDAMQFAATRAIPLYGDRIALYNGACGALQSLLRSQQPVGPCGENTSLLSPDISGWYAKADRNGWVAQTDPPLGTMTPAQVAARSGAEAGYIKQYMHNFKIGGLQPEYLRKLIALAQAHGVKVALVTSPLDSMYFTYISASTWNEVVTYWQSVARATGVPYYDESHAPGYTNMDFVDPQHPSIEGAHRFSTWMAGTIVGPALLCKAPGCVWR